jgi:hypothetical protein
MKQKVRIVNGIFNYFLALILITCPWFLNIDSPFEAKISLLLAGIISLIIAMISNYELGIMKAIKYKENLLLNMLLGTLLMLSPVLFSYRQFDSVPHLFFGALLIVLPFTAYRVHFVKKRRVRAQVLTVK